MKKILAIDCFKLKKGLGKSIGIYNFALRLVLNLCSENHDYKLVVFGNCDNKPDFDISGVEFICIPFDYKNKLICILWELIVVRFYMKKYGVYKIIFPRGFAPIGSGDKCLIVVHDMIPFYYKENLPDVLNKFENAYITWRLRASIRNAKQVVTISEYSRKEIERIVSDSYGHISVIMHGYDNVLSGSEISPLESEYIIGITSSLPHKNARGIIKAYAEYRKISSRPLKLVLVGLKNISEYQTDIDEFYDDIICKTYMKDEEYYTYFRNAQCLLFLSLIEGYGLPPLEAMQFGIPVILSNCASLPEIAADAAILVDPNDSKEIGYQIQRVLLNKGLRDELKAKGEKNLKSFSWKIQIRKYLKLIG